MTVDFDEDHSMPYRPGLDMEDGNVPELDMETGHGGIEESGSGRRGGLEGKGKEKARSEEVEEVE